MSNGSDPNWLTQVVAGMGTALAALGTWAWSHTHRRIDKMITKEAFDQHVNDDSRQHIAFHEELGLQRNSIVKVFEQMRDMEKTGHDRHVELLNAIHSNQK